MLHFLKQQKVHEILLGLMVLILVLVLMSLRVSWVFIFNKPCTPALPGGQGSLGGDLCKGSSWNSEGFQRGADPMLLLEKKQSLS